MDYSSHAGDDEGTFTEVAGSSRSRKRTLEPPPDDQVAGPSRRRKRTSTPPPSSSHDDDQLMDVLLKMTNFAWQEMKDMESALMASRMENDQLKSELAVCKEQLEAEKRRNSPLSNTSESSESQSSSELDLSEEVPAMYPPWVVPQQLDEELQEERQQQENIDFSILQQRAERQESLSNLSRGTIPFLDHLDSDESREMIIPSINLNSSEFSPQRLQEIGPTFFIHLPREDLNSRPSH